MTQALYRRYRPQTFSDVIGQEHVTEPLRQALASGRVGHAYLFSGPRGCGKTTSARILARCLNCEQGPTADPCDECTSCVALARGGAGSVDVIEIDAASHGGVDDARELREKASYGPAQSRYRVFIIDEAHMVTPQGFNALLKIVEEPPEHVKFIFATTEPEKVIGTIRSRTHHYPFRLVPPARLHDYLGEVCASEGVEVEPGVLSFVVRAGGGSVRDSLSVLDQLMAGSTGTLTYAGAAALLGFTEGELLDATVDAIAARDGAAVFRQIDKVIETGHDPRRFVEDLLERFRDLIIVSAVGSNTDESLSAVLRGLPEDQIDRLRQQAAAFGAGELSHAADVTNAGLTAMTGATAPRLQLELLCARLLLPRAAGEDGMIARVDRLERRLEMGGPPPPVAAQAPAQSPPTTQTSRPHAQAAPAAPSRDDGPGASAPAPQHASEDRTDGDRGYGTDPATGGGGVSAGHSERPARVAGADVVSESPGGSTSSRAPSGPAESAAPSPASSARAPGGIDTDAIRRAWPDVLATIFTIRRATWTFLSQHSQVLDYDGQRLLLGISSRGLARTFQQGQHAEVVRQALIDSRGVDCRVEGVPLDEAPPVNEGRAAQRPAPPSPPQPTHAPQAANAPQAHDRPNTPSTADAGPPSEQGGPSGPGRPGGPSGQGRPSDRDVRASGRGAENAGRQAGRPAPGRGSERASVRGARPSGARGDQGFAPPDLPEPPDYDGPPDYDAPPEYDAPADMYDAAPATRPHTAPADTGPASARAHEQVEPDARRQQPAPEAPQATQPATDQATEPAPQTPPTPQPASPSPPQTQPSAPSRPAGSRRPASGHEAFRAAMAARRSQQRANPEASGQAPANASGQANPEARDASQDVGAAGVSADDEDISDLTQVGRPVIAEVLGGVVIAEIEE
ncbi:MAG: DNA polymerase III subunit gamma and tau [Dermatophilus congolensis]|nr:DNA polymerase III subunit gamma and tau [Dermatophilus congolensis]